MRCWQRGRAELPQAWEGQPENINTSITHRDPCAPSVEVRHLSCSPCMASLCWFTAPLSWVLDPTLLGHDDVQTQNVSVWWWKFKMLAMSEHPKCLTLGMWGSPSAKSWFLDEFLNIPNCPYYLTQKIPLWLLNLIHPRQISKWCLIFGHCVCSGVLQALEGWVSFLQLGEENSWRDYVACLKPENQ